MWKTVRQIGTFVATIATSLGGLKLVFSSTPGFNQFLRKLIKEHGVKLVFKLEIINAQHVKF